MGIFFFEISETTEWLCLRLADYKNSIYESTFQGSPVLLKRGWDFSFEKRAILTCESGVSKKCDETNSSLQSMDIQHQYKPFRTLLCKTLNVQCQCQLFFSKRPSMSISMSMFFWPQCQCQCQCWVMIIDQHQCQCQCQLFKSHQFNVNCQCQYPQKVNVNVTFNSIAHVWLKLQSKWQI